MNAQLFEEVLFIEMQRRTSKEFLSQIYFYFKCRVDFYLDKIVIEKVLNDVVMHIIAANTPIF